jgi:hypothetical protein
METYPGNVGSQFTTKLRNKLNLAGQTLNEDVRWQVAMLSIHYTHNVISFKEPCDLRIIVETPDEITTDEPPARTCTTVHPDHLARARDLDETDEALLTTFFQKLSTYIEEANTVRAEPLVMQNYLFGRVELPAKHYENVSAVWQDMASRFNAIFEKRYGVQLIVEQKPDGKICLYSNKGVSISIHVDTPYLGRVLGLESTKKLYTVATATSGDATLSVKRTETPLYELAMRGTRTPRLDALQALYVYGDIVENQYVGDEMAPLLAYVDVTSLPGQRAGYGCEPLVYLPVDKQHIDTITIRITDEHGKNVRFSDEENVVVRLQFRKCKQSIPFVF